MTHSSELIQFPGRSAAWPASLDRLLRPAGEGRTFAAREIPDATLEELHALMAIGPGMADASPTRVIFVTSPAARARLTPHLAPRTRAVATLAPACALVSYDRAFAEQLIAFAGDGVGGVSSFHQPGQLRAAAMRNGVLQGAYLTLSARAVGLETVFLSGYDAEAVAQEFFRRPAVSVIYVAALGYPAEPWPEP